MKNIDEMTPQELREMADKKEAEDLMKVFKTGKLKHNLYLVDSETTQEVRSCGFLYTIDEINKIKKKLFIVVESKGSIVNKYSYGWCSEDEYIYGENDEWAKKHLEDIQDAR